MRDSPNVLKKVAYLPYQNFGHRASPISHSGFAEFSFEIEEVVHSSAWLWKSPQASDIRPRFLVGYPEELKALESKVNWQTILEEIKIDLLLTRELSPAELDSLVTHLEENKISRLVILIGSFPCPQGVLKLLPTQKLLLQNRLFISALPLQRPFESITRANRVLDELKSLEDKIPVYALNVASIQPSFYGELNPTALAYYLIKRHPLLWRFNRFLMATYNKLHFLRQHFASSIESILYLLKKAYWFTKYQIQTRIINKIFRD